MRTGKDVVLAKINGIGINNTISISKTRNRTANRKNRVENGTRAAWFGSNPHSKGDFFSRSSMVRNEISVIKINNKIGRTIEIDKI